MLATTPSNSVRQPSRGAGSTGAHGRWHNARTMAGPDPFARPDPATTLPAFERLASPPPRRLVWDA